MKEIQSWYLWCGNTFWTSTVLQLGSGENESEGWETYERRQAQSRSVFVSVEGLTRESEAQQEISVLALLVQDQSLEIFNIRKGIWGETECWESSLQEKLRVAVSVGLLKGCQRKVRASRSFPFKHLPCRRSRWRFSVSDMISRENEREFLES